MVALWSNFTFQIESWRDLTISSRIFINSIILSNLATRQWRILTFYLQKTPVDIETYVVKQLASCDPILKRHRKQALRVTALHIAASYLWVGTTAGVILSIGEIILLWLISLEFRCTNDVYWLEGLRALLKVLLRSLTWDYLEIISWISYSGSDR